MKFSKFWQRSPRIKCSVKQCLNYNTDEQNCWFEKKGSSGNKQPKIIPYIYYRDGGLFALAICDCFRYNENYKEEE